MCFHRFFLTNLLTDNFQAQPQLDSLAPGAPGGQDEALPDPAGGVEKPRAAVTTRFVNIK